MTGTGFSAGSRGARRSWALWRSSRRWPHPAVAFESPRRLAASLARLAGRCPSARVAVCRELTKRFEEVVRGSAGELADAVRGAARGEITVVVGAAPRERDAASEGALAAVAELVAAGASSGLAAEVVARLTGISRNRLYRGSL